MDYYGARYYDPVVGLFVSADTVWGNPEGIDPYRYVGNNPQTYIDPSGEMYAFPPQVEGSSPTSLNDCAISSCDGGGDQWFFPTDPFNQENHPVQPHEPETTSPTTTETDLNPPITPEEGMQLDASLQTEEQWINEFKTEEQQLEQQRQLEQQQQPQSNQNNNPPQTPSNGPETTSPFRGPTTDEGSTAQNMLQALREVNRASEPDPTTGHSYQQQQQL